MTQLGMLALGLSAKEVADLNAFCRLASRRAITWSVVSTIDQAIGVLAKASDGNTLNACRHYQDAGGCILLLDTGVTQGMNSVRGPLQLSDAFFAVDYFLRNSKSSSAVSSQGATQNLLQAFAEASAVAPAALATWAQPIDKNPIIVQHPATLLQTKSIVRELPVAPVNQKTQVLIVDDSQVAQKYMENCLLGLGVASDLASSGDEALVMLTRHDYKYVFLDVNMVGLDGYQTCRAIKSYKANTCRPSVFMTTSRVGAIDKIRGSFAGCDAYLTKPIDPGQLSALLNQLTLVANVRPQEARQSSQRALGAGTSNT